MPNTILIDSGPLTALFDKDDRFHRPILEFIQGKGFQFLTTTAVLTETTYLLDFSVQAQIHFLQWVQSEGVRLVEVSNADLPRIIELTLKYGDRPMDFADATLVVAAEKTGIQKIISIDADFDIYRLPGKVRIKNIFSQRSKAR